MRLNPTIEQMEPVFPAKQEGLVFVRMSAVHGNGGFAARDISIGARVIEYIGQKITKSESVDRCQASNAYIFTLDENHDLDGDVEWNPARFINHSCEPNCEAELDDGHIWIVALRDIAAGEELSYNYGYDLADYREHPCHCGTPDCVGYIVAEEFFEHVRKQNAFAHAG